MSMETSRVSGWDVSEAATGGFAGMVAANGIYLIPIGETIRARVAIGSLLSIGVGGLISWLASKWRKSLALGFAGGTMGMGLVGLMALLVAPAEALDSPVPFKSFSGMSLGSLAGTGLRRRSGRSLRGVVISERQG
jgi:hypothetical protein